MQLDTLEATIVALHKIIVTLTIVILHKIPLIHYSFFRYWATIYKMLDTLGATIVALHKMQPIQSDYNRLLFAYLKD